MHFDKLVTELSEELKKPLPGHSYQMMMSSIRRIREMMELTGAEEPVPSGVLILLYPDPNETRFVLIQRQKYNGVHSGQISLPGGKYEEFDANLEATALRESKEEVGIDPSKVTLLGKLTELYIPPSNYIVHPFVGFTPEKPLFTRDPKEVEEVIEVSLDDLLDEKNRTKRNIRVRNGMRFYVPCYLIGNSIIWGATAMILSEFREILIRSNARIK